MRIRLIQGSEQCSTIRQIATGVPGQTPGEIQLIEQPLVRLRIEPGERTRVAEVDIRFRGPATSDAAAKANFRRVRQSWSLRRGEPFRQEDWEAAKRTALREMASWRYAAASITESRASVDPKTNRASLTSDIDSGPPFRFGELRVSGTRRYPAELVSNLSPIRPGDALLYRDFLARTDPEDLRRRFMAVRAHYPDELALRLSQLDYDREIAFVALTSAGELAGVSRLACAPDHVSAEYALIVRSDLQGRGLGTALMRLLIDYARADGLERLEGMVLADNRGMLGLIGSLGFEIAPDPEPGVVMSRLELWIVSPDVV